MSVSGEVEKYVKNNKNNKNDDKDIVKEEKIEEETFSIEGSEDNE